MIAINIKTYKLRSNDKRGQSLMIDKGILRDKHRTAIELASILGVSRQAVYISMGGEKETHGLNLRHKLMYRVLFNLNDEILKYLLDDGNFKDNRFKSLDIKKSTLDKREYKTIGSNRLPQAIEALKVKETLKIQHLKQIVSITKTTDNYMHFAICLGSGMQVKDLKALLDKRLDATAILDGEYAKEVGFYTDYKDPIKAVKKLDKFIELFTRYTHKGY